VTASAIKIHKKQQDHEVGHVLGYSHGGGLTEQLDTGERWLVVDSAVSGEGAVARQFRWAASSGEKDIVTLLCTQLER
jgi:hypothetical protein